MFTKYAAQCNAPMCLYTSHGTWKVDGSWGLLAKIGDPIDGSGKARAVRDWAAKNK
jgi:hypothetical protein